MASVVESGDKSSHLHTHTRRVHCNVVCWPSATNDDTRLCRWCCRVSRFGPTRCLVVYCYSWASPSWWWWWWCHKHAYTPTGSCSHSYHLNLCAHRRARMTGDWRMRVMSSMCCVLMRSLTMQEKLCLWVRMCIVRILLSALKKRQDSCI